jgi:translation initiation factor RLI1
MLDLNVICCIQAVAFADWLSGECESDAKSVWAKAKIKVSINASQKSPAHGFKFANPIFIIRKSKRKFSRSPVLTNEILQILNMENFLDASVKN